MSGNGFLEQELVDRMNKAERQVYNLTKIPGTSDLLTMFNALTNIRAALSSEAVNCRRLHRATPTFIELHDKFTESLKHLENHITFASLKFKKRKENA